MKTLFLLLSLLGVLGAADVNATLYEGGDKAALYKAMEKQISTAQAAGVLPKAQADVERAILERLRRTAAQKPVPKPDPNTLFSKTRPTLEQGYRALSEAADAAVKVENAEHTLDDIQSKLAFLKQNIEDLTTEEKSNLQAYQLQFAFYKLQQQNLEEKREREQHYRKEIIKVLQQRLTQLPCDETALQTTLDQAQAEIDKSKQHKVSAEIVVEGAELEENVLTDQLRKTLAASQKRYNAALLGKLEASAKLALCQLETKRAKRFFALLDDMGTDTENLTGSDRARFEQMEAQLRILAKTRLGVTSLVVGNTLYETRALLEEIGDVLTDPLFVFNERPISVLSLVKSLLILIAGFFLGRFYKRRIARLARRWPDMSQMSLRLASNIGYYLLILIAGIIAISSLGIDMSSISLIAGALSIGVGFGLQTVVSNFIAGIILMFERTIRIGDTIEITDVLRGRVTDMRIRSTTVKTFDNIDIVVPNSSFIQNNVINWTLEDATRRLHIPFGVAYGTKVDAVKKAVLGELEQSSLSYIKNDPEKTPEVWMVGMNSSSVDFELIVWVEWANKNRPSALRSDFLILIYYALYNNGIQIPFPQLDLYVKQLPKSQE
jgi:potassium-dependent mechanosensitive channel